MGKSSLTKNLITIIFLISSFIFMHTFAFAESTIEINSQASKPGEKVTFTVSISPGTDDFEEIRAFGFDIQYNDKILEYISYSTDSMKESALFPPQINKRAGGSLTAGGSFINPLKIDKTINLFHIDFKCLDCTESETYLHISGKIDDFKNFASRHGTFSCLGTKEEEKEEEKEQASAAQTDQEKTDVITQEDSPEIRELTNKTTKNGQQNSGLDAFYPKIYSETTANDQETGGGGAAGGQPQESAGISDLSIAFRSIPSVQSTFPEDGAQNIQTTTPIKMTFNQSMSQIMLEDAFVVEPYLDGQFTWNEDFTEVEFIPDSQLEPGVVYNVQLTDQAADTYGQYIDGDFDGKMGGKFSFSFQTKDTGNGKDIADKKPLVTSPDITRCFIMSL